MFKRTDVEDLIRDLKHSRKAQVDGDIKRLRRSHLRSLAEFGDAGGNVKLKRQRQVEGLLSVRQQLVALAARPDLKPQGLASILEAIDYADSALDAVRPHLAADSAEGRAIDARPAPAILATLRGAERR